MLGLVFHQVGRIVVKRIIDYMKAITMHDKIAICILAHTDPVHLSRLVKSFDFPFFDIFIHLDGKVGLESFSDVGKNCSQSEVKFIQRREICSWGGYSLVQAELNLYREVVSSGKNYHRAIFLSGLDYPIWSNEELHRYFTCDDREFISCGPMSQADIKRKIHRYNSLDMNRYMRFILRPLPANFGVKCVSFSFKDQVVSGPFCFGVQWKALTTECIQDILEIVDGNPQLEKIFKTSHAPDELLIPSILFPLNKYRERIVMRYSAPLLGYNRKAVIHFLNYDPVIQVFTADDFDKVYNSGKPFFRKARTGESDKLLDMIDSMREGT